MKFRGLLLSFLLFAPIACVPSVFSQAVEASKADKTAIPSVTQFGARNDGKGDNLGSFRQAIRTLTADKSHGARLFIPPGRYRFSAPLHVNRGMVLEGGSGAGRNAGTVLVFDPGVDGIIIDRSTTSDDGGAGDWTVIRDLAVLASAQGGNANGITMHARAHLENVYVRGFGGNGVEIAAWARGNGPNTNANNWSMDNLFVEANGGHGIHVVGADANAGVAIGVSSMGNGGWGFLDESFLGNTYVGCHTENNKKGGYAVTNRNARSIFIGSYTESGQPDNHIESPSMVIGGLFGPVQGSGYLAIDGHLSPNWTVRNQKDPKLAATLGFAGDVPRGVLSFSATDGSLPYRLEYQKGEVGWWDLIYGELGNGTVLSFSTNKADGGAAQIRFPNGFSIGRGTNAHKFSASLTPPVSGEHQVGEVVFSSDPDRTGYVGWVVVKEGTPGEWSPFGALVRTTTTIAGADTSQSHLQDASFSLPDARHTVSFDASSGSLQKVVLHADVASSVIAHLVAGSHLDFLICQDETGGHLFYWPTIVRGGMNVGTYPRSCSAQSFVFDGKLAFATSAGATSSNGN